MPWRKATLAIDTPGCRHSWTTWALKGWGRGSLAHGNPDDKGDGVHVFLGGHLRPYCLDRVGEFAGRLVRQLKLAEDSR